MFLCKMLILILHYVNPLELWRNTCTCNTIGGPSLEYVYLFYIVSVMCSRDNDLWWKKEH